VGGGAGFGAGTASFLARIAQGGESMVITEGRPRMNPHKGNVTWSIEMLLLDGQRLTELAARLKRGADLDWLTTELADVENDLRLVRGALAETKSGKDASHNQEETQ
jgi:hypothetical protein